jgi:hypothetical protein
MAEASTGILSMPLPQASTNAPVTPRLRNRSATWSTRSVAMVPGGAGTRRRGRVFPHRRHDVAVSAADRTR